MPKFQKGQSLVELLVAIAVGVILIGGSATLMGVSLKSYGTIRKHFQANVLIRQTIEVIQNLAHYDWHSVYDLTKYSNYKISLSGNTWAISSGLEISTVNNIPYKRYFEVEDVRRDGSGNIADAGTIDPNTLTIIVWLDYGVNYEHWNYCQFYVTRSENNKTLHQTDWSGGSGQIGPISNSYNKFDTSSNINYASTTGQITMITATTTPAELISSVLDTGVSGGAGFNSLLWQGSLGTGGIVKFQIAFSNSSSGPWTYYGPTSTSDWYQPNPNISIAFPTAESASPQNKRYIRYKVNLSTTGTSPTINDIIINWSP